MMYYVTAQGVPQKYGVNRRNLGIHAIEELKQYFEQEKVVSAKLQGAIQVSQSRSLFLLIFTDENSNIQGGLDMTVKLKRAYEVSAKNDGKRILVDRLWPRGVSKEDANVYEWLKEIGPSNELRQWFDHDSDKFDEF